MFEDKTSRNTDGSRLIRGVPDDNGAIRSGGENPPAPVDMRPEPPPAPPAPKEAGKRVA